MDPVSYEVFTQQLTQNLEQDARVLGLVAVGSMAGSPNPPDRWSDHDFLILSAAGAEEELRAATNWLPAYLPIVLHLRETQHGVKVMYEDGHLLEFAIFNREDFRLAKINSHHVLIDRQGFGELVEELVGETRRWAGSQQREDHWLVGQFLTHLLVGVARHARGEKMSGAKFVKNLALEDLLRLLALHVPSEHAHVLDSLDPLRRFELAYPSLGREIGATLSLDTAAAARKLLAIARREMGAVMATQEAAVATVKASLDL